MHPTSPVLDYFAFFNLDQAFFVLRANLKSSFSKDSKLAALGVSGAA